VPAIGPAPVSVSSNLEALLGFRPIVTTYKNTVLRNIDPEAIKRLELEPVTLDTPRPIEKPGDEIQNLYFIESGVGSMTTVFQNGHEVEVGLFGWESVIGVSAFMGTKRSLNNIFMQVPGKGYKSRIKVAEKEYRRYERFHELCLRYVQAQLMQATQTGACNASHDVEQRMARWLLLCRERSETDRIDLTHEFLAQMLGTRRTTVTITARALQDLGLIDYKRGKITIIDHSGLEKTACECFHVVRDHLNNYHEVEIGFAV
jgi:CRP-like cAMP-binding protein